jgi:hypothetical protein
MVGWTEIDNPEDVSVPTHFRRCRHMQVAKKLQNEAWRLKLRR